jgi:hypothetical protein
MATSVKEKTKTSTTNTVDGNGNRLCPICHRDPIRSYGTEARCESCWVHRGWRLWRRSFHYGSKGSLFLNMTETRPREERPKNGEPLYSAYGFQPAANEVEDLRDHLKSQVKAARRGR